MVLSSEGPESIEVQTYSSYKADERPTALVVNERKLKVVEVINRWWQAGRDPGQGVKAYFRVKAEDDQIYIIFQDQWSGSWFRER